MKTRKTFAWLASVAAAGSFVGAGALGAERSWDGGGANDNWTTPGNWLGDAAPVPLDLLTFSGATRLTPNNDFAAGTAFGGIGFDPTAGSFTLGGNAVTLAQNANVVNNSASLQTVNLPLALAFGNHLFNGGTSGLALNGAITRGTGAVARFQGTVSSTTLANDSTGIIGGWANHNGTEWAAVNAGQVVPYTAYVDLGPTPTTIPNSPGANFKLSSNLQTLTLARGVTDINTLNMTVQNGTVVFQAATATEPESVLRFGPSGGLMRSYVPVGGLIPNLGTTDGVGAITAGGADNQPGELYLSAGGGGTPMVSSAFNIRSKIVDNGTGSVRVVKTGALSTFFNTVNTYTGGTYVAEGEIRAQGPVAGGALGTGSVQVAGGARVWLDPFGATSAAARTFANEFYVAGFGQPSAGALSESAIRISREAIATGTIHLTGDAQISYRFATGAGPRIEGQITGPHALSLGGGGSVGGQVGTLTLSNSANDWTGDTTLLLGAVIIGGTGEVIPNGPGKGNVNFASSNSATLNLNGRTETINGLNGGANALDLHRIISSGAPGTLRVGDNNANGNFGPGSYIVESVGTTNFSPISVTKLGSGEQIFAGNNTYTGVTTVEAGRLVLKNNGTTNSWFPVLDGPGGAEVKAGALVFDYSGGGSSPAANVLAILDAGFDQTPKFSAGDIRSSTATDQKGLGWADDTAASQVTVAYTRYGDANLDFQVNLQDFNRLAANFGSTSAVWAQGDFNYDGVVNLQDFNLLAANFGQIAAGTTVTPHDWANLSAAIPEPACIIAIALAPAALLRRRKRGA